MILSVDFRVFFHPKKLCLTNNIKTLDDLKRKDKKDVFPTGFFLKTYLSPYTYGIYQNKHFNVDGK